MEKNGLVGGQFKMNEHRRGHYMYGPSFVLTSHTIYTYSVDGTSYTGIDARTPLALAKGGNHGDEVEIYYNLNDVMEFYCPNEDRNIIYADLIITGMIAAGAGLFYYLSSCRLPYAVIMCGSHVRQSCPDRPDSGIISARRYIMEEHGKVSGLYQKNLERFEKNKRWRDAASIVCILLGSFIVAVNMNTFVEQGKLVPGGFSGLAKLLQRVGLTFYDTKISFTLLNVVFNAVPAVFAYRLVGKKFTILSCVSLFTVSILVDELPVIPITGDILLISVFGGIINGLGMSLVLNSNASGGGTDFIAMSLSARYKVSTFNYMLLFSAVIILISGAIFGMDKALYSIIFQFCNTQVINTFYKKYKKKTLMIVTDNPAAVSADLLELTNHSSTILKGLGSYTAHKNYLIYTVLSDGDVRKMKKRIREQYPDTFVNVINSSDVVGNFYIQPFE